MAKSGAIGGQRVGTVVTVVCLAVLGFLLYRSYGEQARRAPEPPPPAAIETQPRPTPAAPSPPALSVAPPAIGRAELINAAAAAASAHATRAAVRPAAPAGAPAAEPLAQTPAQALRPEASSLVGRRFGLRLPFGCTGPAAEAAAGASWVYSADRRSVRIVVRPETWTGSALIQAIAAPETYEAVEGFWVTRPWLLSEDCPALPTDPTTTTPSASSPETLGLGVFFEEGGSRVARRDQRPYEIVLRLDGAPQTPAPQGFRLLLEGRITGFPDGRAFRCRSGGANQRPVCVAAVRIDSVAVESLAGETLGSWEVAQLNTP